MGKINYTSNNVKYIKKIVSILYLLKIFEYDIERLTDGTVYPFGQSPISHVKTPKPHMIDFQ